MPHGGCFHSTFWDHPGFRWRLSTKPWPSSPPPLLCVWKRKGISVGVCTAAGCCSCGSSNQCSCCVLAHGCTHALLSYGSRHFAVPCSSLAGHHLWVNRPVRFAVSCSRLAGNCVLVIGTLLCRLASNQFAAKKTLYWSSWHSWCDQTPCARFRCPSKPGLDLI
jgi:hypothetical protein